MTGDIEIQSKLDISALSNKVRLLKQEIGKVIVGQEHMVDQILAAIMANGHILIEGVPGIAKTLTAKLVAKCIDAQFSRIQFTPDLMPSDVTGTTVYNMSTSQFQFNNGPIFANIILIDEINRAPAKTQAALFEVMEERQVTADGTTYKMDLPFLVIATQNPVEHEGTYRLPEAQLDRFFFKIEINYPNLEEEIEILNRNHELKGKAETEQVQKLLDVKEIFMLQSLIKQISIEPKLREFIAKIVVKTRNNNSLFLGASPRASLAMMLGSKAWAAIHGRDYVIPEDIIEVAYPVLRHRIQLTAEKEMEGASIDDMIKKIISGIEIPR